MTKFYLTNKAVEDLADIWNYTLENWSERQADKYYDLLIMTCSTLANDPKMGKQYDILSEEILGYKIRKHIIFFQIISKREIEIVRILHGMMDLKSKI
jgi:toxin ParE1/3/4